MTAQISPALLRRTPDELIEIWADNLKCDDVTLAPFMPCTARCPSPGASPTPQMVRLAHLIAQAQGHRGRIDP